MIGGAVWTAPVVAAVVAAPAVAGSTNVMLFYTKSSYRGKACEIIENVEVRCVRGGVTPVAGKTITASLSDGYTYIDGRTVFSGTTDRNGLISLPGIVVSAGGGKSTFVAIAAAENLTATVPVLADDAVHAHQMKNGETSDIPRIPKRSLPVNPNGDFLAPNGDLYVVTNHGVSPKRQASNVISSDGTHVVGIGNTNSFVTSDLQNGAYAHRLNKDGGH